MNEKKMRKRNFTFAALLLIMVFALCMTLISCGGSETDDIAKNEVKAEQTAEGNANSKDTKNEQDEEAAVKKEDKKETAQKTESQKTTQKSEQATQKETQKPTQAKQVCYISIEGYCSSKEISLQGGDTAYSVLCRSGASVSGSGHYIKGINGRFEFDEGPTSGWVYYVNGSRPTVGCGNYSVKAGDSITWDYVTKL